MKVCIYTAQADVLFGCTMYVIAPALLNPQTSVLVQTRHCHTRNLNSETYGDSTNAFLRCGNVLVHQRPIHLIAFMLGLVWASTWPCWSVRNQPWSTAFCREPLSQYSSRSHVSNSCSSLFPCVSCACTGSIECPACAESALNVLHMQSQHCMLGIDSCLFHLAVHALYVVPPMPCLTCHPFMVARL